MERRFREVTVKRKKRSFRLLTGGICLALLLKVPGGTPDDWKRGLLEKGVSSVQPAIFKYQNNLERTKPTFLQMVLPHIFTYIEETEGIQLIVENITAESVSALDTEAEWKESDGEESDSEESNSEESAEYCMSSKVRLALAQDMELALLQENIYEEKLQVSAEVLKPNELIETLKNNREDVDGEGEVLMQGESLAQYQDMTQLIKDFYIVDASTSPDAALLDVDALTSYDCSIDRDGEGVQILIYHSHSQEGFADSIPGDKSTTIVGAGDRLAALLEEYGYRVLHHEGVYDLPTRDNAYSNALPIIEQILKENPSIQVVIDLHRDAVAEGTRLVTNIDGVDYAKFMFFNGICRSTKGPITYLNNPYLEENLAFSFQSQRIAESFFPGITRKIYLKAWRYNMHLVPRNMLIELGAQTNTVEEIMNTTEILAFVIDKVLSGQ